MKKKKKKKKEPIIVSPPELIIGGMDRSAAEFIARGIQEEIQKR